jgi:hypothetical protein
MLENNIARKCTATLIGVALVVFVSVLASWWASAPGWASGGTTASAKRSASAAPKLGQAPDSSAPSAAPRLELMVPKAAAVPAAGAAERDQLERKSFQLEMENARLRGRLDDMLNWILDNVRGTFPLPEGQMANLRLIPVDTNMQVSDDLAQVLRLNDAEVDRLDTAFIGTRSVLQELENENISVDKPAENQVVLNIPPYAEEGQLVREELYGDLKKTLGAARFDRFLQVAEAGLDEKFEYFGEADRTLEFEAMKDEKSGASQLFVRDERVIPSKDDPLRQNIVSSEQIVTNLPAEYYPYWNLLPDYVTRFSPSK